MIIVKLMGGLGNQMFQYAAGRSLALKNNTDLFLDLEFLLDRTPRENYIFRDFDLPVFNVTYNIADKRITSKFFPASGIFEKLKRKLTGESFSYYHEPHFHYDPKFLQLKGNYYVEGYFQSEKYFNEIRDVIRKDFAQDYITPAHVSTLLDRIKRDKDSVCLHVRRTDFVTNPVSNSVHGVLDHKYYSSALRKLEELGKGISIYVFSDDIEWCRKNLTFEHPVYFVEDEYAGEKCAFQFYLMRNCRNFIIPNSSFSWWAAWLANEQDKTVIAPLRWFTDHSRNSSDVIPESWIRI